MRKTGNYNSQKYIEDPMQEWMREQRATVAGISGSRSRIDDEQMYDLDEP